MGIESDRARTVVVLMSWALDIAKYNKELVNTLADKLAKDNAFLKLTIKFTVTAISNYIPRKMLFTLISFFVSVNNTLTCFRNMLVVK